MKVLLALLFILVATPVYAQRQVNIGWDPNPVEDGVIQYNIYVDNLPAQGISALSCTAVLCSFSVILANGSHTIALTAQNFWDVSQPSVIKFTIGAPGKPINIRIVQ